MPHDQFGVPAEAKEAVVFTLLDYCTLNGYRTTLPRCTGAARSTILGQITPGDNYESLMRHVFGGRGACQPIRTLRLLR